MTVEWLIIWLLCSQQPQTHAPAPGVPVKVTAGGSPNVGRMLLKV